MIKRKLIPKGNRERIIKRDGGRCVYCGLTERLEVDHVVPIKHDGTNAFSNLVTSCISCNRTKNGNRLLYIFEQQILEIVYWANISAGIDGSKDAAKLKKVAPRKRGRKRVRLPGVSRKQHFEDYLKRRNGEIRKTVLLEKLVNAFSVYDSLYLAETGTGDETKRLLHRMRKRNARHLCIPANNCGGKLFLFDTRDLKSDWSVANLNDATDRFMQFMDNTGNGYLSGSLGKC